MSDELFYEPSVGFAEVILCDRPTTLLQKNDIASSGASTRGKGNTAGT
jgi:hypothetical protein